jgi:RNA polymerase sigma-70 factor (ECF subfamily)
MRAWLFRIAANLRHDEFRQWNARDGAQSNEILNHVYATDSPAATVEHQDELALALKLMDALPERQRVVLYLVAVEGLKLPDVCEILNINANAAKVSLSLARKRMREEVSRRSAKFE